MAPVLAWLREQALPWGIVTNKATRFAAPLVEALGLADRGRGAGLRRHHGARQAASGAAARGGAAARRWPPATASTSATTCATSRPGSAAGMATIVAAWGYLGDGDALAAWGADH